jgi:hypothetical protein
VRLFGVAIAVSSILVGGCAEDRHPLDLPRDGTFMFVRTLACLGESVSFEVYAHPNAGQPIRGLSIHRGHEEVASLYFARSHRLAKEGLTALREERPQVYGNVVLVWKSHTEEAETLTERSLSRSAR